jgi:hypothetical protein
MDLGSGNMPWQNVNTALSQTAQVTGIAGGLSKPIANRLASHFGVDSSVAKALFAGEASALKSAPKTLRAISALGRIAKGAPIVGDALGVVIDGKHAMDEFGKGNKAKGLTHAGAAGLGAIAMGLGVKAAAVGAVNGWNPFGWAALGVGAAATGVGYAATQMDGANEKLVKKHAMFDGAAAAYYAMDGQTTNDGQLIRALQGKSISEMNQIKSDYLTRYGRHLENDIKWDTSGHYEDTLLAMTNGYDDRKNYSANRGAQILEGAMRGWGTNEADVIGVLTRRSPEQLRELKRAFKARTGQSLESWIRSDTGGQFERSLISLLHSVGN